MYQLGRGAPLAATLPRTFPGSARWEGKPPKTLLYDLGKPKCSGAGDKEPIYTSSETGGEPPEVEAGSPGKRPKLGDHQGEGNFLEKSGGSQRKGGETEETGTSQRRGGGVVEENEGEAERTEQSQAREGRWEAEVEFAFGYQAMKASSGGGQANRGDAENAAALAGLHAVQALFDARVLTAEAAEKEAGLGFSLETESEGTAVVDYRILLESGGEGENFGGLVDAEKASLGGVVLEDNRGFHVPRGTGAVLPELESCLDTCPQGEVRRFQMRALPSWLPFLRAKGVGTVEPGSEKSTIGSDVETHDLSPALGSDQYGIILKEIGTDSAPIVSIEVRLCGYVEPPELRLEGALFTPSLATQRMDFALRLVEQCEAASVLDLGCGAGALLEAVVEKATCVRKLAGVDISERALQKARKGVKAKWEKRAAAEGTREGMLASVDDVEVLQGSMLELDDRFKGWDLATCIEGVEHLDPAPLAGIGPAVFGRLRPKMLLVSTPNIEYNPLLQAAAMGKGTDVQKEGEESPRLRNEDHRFEWTRNEFRTWAKTLASEYGYSVEFSGVGGDGEEEGPGFCTQIAVFKEMQVVR
jgi:2-polyprenyl-3-methyl-5-hydroxy-6-metoxy-1,4-benzoquinol methylase